MESQLARLLLLMPLQLYHLPPPLPLQSVTLHARSLDASPCCPVLLCFSRYCTFRLKMFYFFVFVPYVLFV
uniref:Uncharacterized protein n=1 Tax=Bos indicus x Bos taurus TaxID=30522 RepID=A0A4W2GY56_BOBOX